MSAKRLLLAGLAIAIAAPIQNAAAQGNEVHFHHVRINTVDPEKSMAFYKKILGAVEIQYRGKVPALFAERSFFLFNKVDLPPKTINATSLSHIGWAGKDGPSEFEWLKKQGVEIQTPVSPLGNNHYMYFYGEDKELIEIYTGGQNHRFEHLHFWCTDPNATAKWFGDHLGLPYSGPREPGGVLGFWTNFTRVDNVNLVLFGRPDFETPFWPDEQGEEFEPTEGSTFNHLAFSFRNIQPVFEKMKADGVEIVSPIQQRADMGHKSFFVMGPDKLLIEVVEDRPIPEGIWE